MTGEAGACILAADGNRNRSTKACYDSTVLKRDRLARCPTGFRLRNLDLLFPTAVYAGGGELQTFTIERKHGRGSRRNCPFGRSAAGRDTCGGNQQNFPA